MQEDIQNSLSRIKFQEEQIQDIYETVDGLDENRSENDDVEFLNQIKTDTDETFKAILKDVAPDSEGEVMPFLEYTGALNIHDGHALE